MSTCRHCTAPVVWVQAHRTGTKPRRSIPLDATPEGRLLVVSSGNAVLVDETTVRLVATGQGSYRTHAASCLADRDRHTRERD